MRTCCQTRQDRSERLLNKEISGFYVVAVVAVSGRGFFHGVLSLTVMTTSHFFIMFIILGRCNDL